ncbi:hypothetical protein CF15_07820 [Pyrodictium occultum]|uniref:Phosphate-starvation-inducible E n=1 Tax=Pyrodictium occultum TaxID=2309 RepID=A0A0V8RX45_PYROC|nr:phosphate-starvation-inducible PsiE family protein [Pyrodictium occultum]KSW12609.1 hypothetical protein CF15_07820 [Pyrodictium occultum]
MTGCDAEDEEKTRESRLVHIIAEIYEAFEIAALAALVTATSLAIADFFYTVLVHGFIYNEAVERILLIFVFIDLTRTVVGSLIEGRFRMDILFEAITIAVARDLIGTLALMGTSFDVTRTAVLTGMLATVVALWVLARRTEVREPAPLGVYRYLRKGRPSGKEAGKRRGGGKG